MASWVVDGNGDGILQINEFFMRGDIVVLATPEMAGLPYVISGLVAAGGLAAMSTAMVYCWQRNGCHMICITRSLTKADKAPHRSTYFYC